ALVYHDVVEHHRLGAAGAAARDDRRLEREAGLGGECAAHQRIERPVEGLRGRGGEEPDPAEGDGEDGGGAAVQGAGGAQRGVVALPAGRARTAAATPGPVRPPSSSCCARGACSKVRSGTPSATTRTSGALACTMPVSEAPKPLTTVPSSIVTSNRCSRVSASSVARSIGFRNRQFTTVRSQPSPASAAAASRAGRHITPTASRAQSRPRRRISQLPYGTGATSAAGGASAGALSRG